MAIDRKKDMAFDMEVSEEMPNQEGIDNEAVDAVEAVEPAGETVTVGADMLGGQKVSPGDVVKLEVATVSDEDGTVTLRYASPKPGGIDKAAAAFNEGP